MIIECSNGHRFDISTFEGRMQCGDKRPGDRCGVCTSYDRMSGSKYCGRVLKQICFISAYKNNMGWFYKITADKTIESSIGYKTKEKALKEADKEARMLKLKVYPENNIKESR